jgi:hypothetical protein
LQVSQDPTELNIFKTSHIFKSSIKMCQAKIFCLVGHSNANWRPYANANANQNDYANANQNENANQNGRQL